MKVLFWNMLLIAAAFSISGYLLMNRSFQISMDLEVQHVMSENQLIIAGVETEMVNRILQNSFFGKEEEWQTIGNEVLESLKGTDICFQIRNEEQALFEEQERPMDTDTNLLTGDLKEGRKQYMFYTDADRYYVAAAGSFSFSDHTYYVVNQRDISSVYMEQELQAQYYRYLTGALLILCAVILSVITGVLTAPIRRLKKTTGRIAEGNYRTRARIHSKDEIGSLAKDFNVMAEAVENNINELEEENRRKEEFVANFTHELKTPLTSVIGYAEMLSAQDLTMEERQKAAEYIFHEGVRLENMSMKLFEMFLLNQEDLVMHRIYVPDFMESIGDSAGPLAEADGIKLIVQPVSACICGDGTLLKTVFINMIDNARKASAGGQSILFRSYVTEDSVVLEVKDHGCGIPAEDLHKITEAFYMVDKSRSRQKGGAGLGLSLAAKILEKHGAALEVESAVGEGTIMRVEFDREQEEE